MRYIVYKYKVSFGLLRAILLNMLLEAKLPLNTKEIIVSVLAALNFCPLTVDNI